MSFPSIQVAFSAGELSPALFGHVSLERYDIGLATCRNIFVNFKGSANSRAGTAFVGFSKQTGRSIPPRVITFQFSINQGLMLEFGNLYMRVVSNGSLVTDSTKNITGITQANPGVVTSVAHGFTNGKWVDLAGILGMVELNGLTGIVANVTANTFTLTDVYGSPINTTTYAAYASGGTAARIFELVTPYAEADLDYLKWTQSADVMSFCCWNQVTGTLYAPRDLSRLSDSNWTLAITSFGVTIVAPTGVVATAYSSDILSTWYSYVVTAIASDTGEESIASSVVNVENNDISVAAGSNTVGWTASAGAASYNVYKGQPSYGTFPAAGISYGLMATSIGQNAVDTNITPDYTFVPPVHTDPFAVGAISDVLPTAGGANYSQQTIGYTVFTATGSGFDGTPVVVAGKFSGFVIRNHGKGYLLGDSIALTDSGGGVATGNYVAVTNAADGDHIIINGVDLTFRRPNVAPAYGEVTLGNTLALTLQSLSNYLNSSVNINFIVATFTYDATHLYVTYKTPGTDGNAFTLSATAPGTWTRSGATLTGGGTAGAGATASITLGPQSGTYPSVVNYFQQRRVYGASPNDPDTYWMTVTGQYRNFDARIPPTDSDSITGTPWALQVNGIQWFVSMPGGLVTFTGLSAWQLGGAGGALNATPITPLNQQAEQQGYNGASATVPPLQIGPEIIYLQAKGSVFRDLSYNVQTNIYAGIDLTYLSSHLFTGYTMSPPAWCEEPYKLIWVPRSDGTLLSLTFLKDQEVIAWARHDTNGQIWSVCSVTEPPVDALYLATQRYPNGKSAYMIERMNDRIWQSVEDVWAVDCALELDQPTPAANLTASSAWPGIPSGVTGRVGGSGYSAGTTGTINDPTGTGAVVTLTISAGAVVAIAIAGGTNYTYPVLQFNDPAGTGAGASATVILNNSTTFVSSAGVFVSGDVGSVIRMGGGIATITAYADSSHVTGQITSPITQTIPNSGPPAIPAIAKSGDWTLTKPTTTIRGLQYLEGATVTGTADGVPITPRVVSATGSVTLDTAASAVILGLSFTPQIQSLYLNTGSPTGQGRRKKIGALTARLEASYVSTIQAGTNQTDGSTLNPPQIAPPWTDMVGLQLKPDQGPPPYGSTVPPLWTGDVRVPVKGGFDTPGQVALQQTAPQALNLLAFLPEWTVGDDVETTRKLQDA